MEQGVGDLPFDMLHGGVFYISCPDKEEGGLIDGEYVRKQVKFWWSSSKSGEMFEAVVGTGVGFLLVGCPLRLAALGPKVVSAFDTSRRLAGMFVNTLLSTTARNVARDWHPIGS